ncbi:MAG: hypothetical protein GXZ15_06350, partial [Campylobacter sp.]|nr:hypothetical protein [Campylobacter sp.]
YQYCSVNCMFEHAYQNNLDFPINPRVVDLTSLKYVDATTAYYVYGSSKPGTMSVVSSYAFANQNEAKKFQSEFGGEILTLEEIASHTKKDIADWAAIRAKRKMMKEKSVTQ